MSRKNVLSIVTTIKNRHRIYRADVLPENAVHSVLRLLSYYSEFWRK